MAEIQSCQFDDTRLYIPLPGGWEVQTKGKGSSYRRCDTKTGERHSILVNDGAVVQAYATETAASYYDDYGNDPNETPANCAETDISYWENP